MAHRLVQRVDRARPRNMPTREHAAAGAAARPRPPHDQQRRQTWKSTAKMLVMAMRLCTRYTPSQRRSTVASRADRSRGQHAARQEEEHGRQRDAGQGGHQPPGPGLVAEDPDPERDQQLGQSADAPTPRAPRPAGTAARSWRGRPRRTPPPPGRPSWGRRKTAATSAKVRASQRSRRGPGRGQVHWLAPAGVRLRPASSSSA